MPSSRRIFNSTYWDTKNSQKNCVGWSCRKHLKLLDRPSSTPNSAKTFDYFQYSLIIWTQTDMGSLILPSSSIWKSSAMKPNHDRHIGIIFFNWPIYVQCKTKICKQLKEFKIFFKIIILYFRKYIYKLFTSLRQLYLD